MACRVKALPDPAGHPIETIESLHKQYTDLFSKETRLIRAKNTDTGHTQSRTMS